MSNKVCSTVVHPRSLALLLFSCACSGLLVGTTPAFAQTADVAAPEAKSVSGDILVTAQRRAQNIQDVPLSVTAATAEQLQTVGATTIKALPLLAPTLTVNDSLGYVSAYIRGVGSTNFAPGAFPSTATYVDDVYISKFTSGNLELDNVESIQVLAGPQGALYGRNATGGAIIITTKSPKPGDPLSGKIEASYGNYDDKQLSVSVSSGLGEMFAGGLSYTMHKRDGFYNNVNPAPYYQEDQDDRDTVNLAGKLVFEPNDQFSAKLSLAYAREFDRAGSPYVQIAPNDPGPVPGLSRPQSYYYLALNSFGVPAADAFAAASSMQFPTKWGDAADTLQNPMEAGAITNAKFKPGGYIYTKEYRAALSMTYAFEGFDLTSVTGYTDNINWATAGYLAEVPATSGFPSTLGGGAGGPTKTYQQEVRAASNSGPIDWLIGANYYKELGRVKVGFSLPFGNALLIADDHYEDEAYAFFGQATVPLTDKFSVTGGARYTGEKYSLYDILVGGSNPDGTGEDFSEKYHKLTYTARIEYKANDDLLLYSGLTTGFKSGSLNATAPQLASGEVSPENLKSYEAGFKSEWMDGRIRFNGAFYYYDYKNIQNVVVTGTSAYLLGGLDGEGYGADFSLDASVTDNLALNANLTLLDTKYKNNVVAPDGFVFGVDGNRLPGAPKFSVGGGATYTLPMERDASLVLNVNATYNDGFWYDPQNLLGTGGDAASSFTIANARATYTLPGGNLSFAAWGNNIFDEEYWRGGIVALSGLSYSGNQGTPAQYGGTISYKF